MVPPDQVVAGAPPLPPGLGPNIPQNALLAPSDDPNAPAAVWLVNTIQVQGPGANGLGYYTGTVYVYQLVNGNGDSMGNNIPVTEVVTGNENGNPYFYTATQDTGDVTRFETGPGQISDFVGDSYLTPYPNPSSNGSLTTTQTWYVVWNGQQTGLTTVNQQQITTTNGIASTSVQNLVP